MIPIIEMVVLCHLKKNLYITVGNVSEITWNVIIYFHISEMWFAFETIQLKIKFTLHSRHKHESMNIGCVNKAWHMLEK